MSESKDLALVDFFSELVHAVHRLRESNAELIKMLESFHYSLHDCDSDHCWRGGCRAAAVINKARAEVPNA